MTTEMLPVEGQTIFVQQVIEIGYDNKPFTYDTDPYGEANGTIIPVDENGNPVDPIVNMKLIMPDGSTAIILDEDQKRVATIRDFARRNIGTNSTMLQYEDEPNAHPVSTYGEYIGDQLEPICKVIPVSKSE